MLNIYSHKEKNFGQINIVVISHLFKDTALRLNQNANHSLEIMLAEKQLKILKLGIGKIRDPILWADTCSISGSLLTH